MNEIARWLQERDAWTQKSLANQLGVRQQLISYYVSNGNMELSRKTQAKMDELRNTRINDEREVDKQIKKMVKQD